MFTFRKLFIGLIMVLPAVVVVGQAQPGTLYSKLAQSKIDTNRINILDDLGRYYKEFPDRNVKDIDSSITLFGQALQLSLQLHNKNKEMKTRSLLAGSYFIKGDIQAGRTMGLGVIDYYRQLKDLKQQAHFTGQYASDLPAKTPADIAERIKWYEESARLFGLVHDQLAEINASKRIADLHIQEGNLDLAEQELLDVIKRYKAIGYNKLTVVYEQLATICVTRGDLKKQLEYQLKQIDNMDATADTANADRYYRRLADSYLQVGMYDEAIKWGNRSMQFAMRNKNYVYVYSILDLMVQVMLHQYKTAEALALVQQTIKNIKPVTLNQKIAAYECLAICYANLKQLDKAEKNYLSADSVFNIQNDDKNFLLRQKNYNNMFIHQAGMASFYYRWKKYSQAKFFLAKAAALPKATITAASIAWLYREQYKIDSATGDYQAALNHLVEYRKIQDSIFNITKSKQLADLHVKYETDKKEQAIKTLQALEQQAVLERNIKQADLEKVSLQRDVQKGQLQRAALQRSAELQRANLERNIQRTELQKVTLQRNAELQKANFERNAQQLQIQKVNTQRNITIAGIGAFMLISGLAYNGYRNKKRSNRVLQTKQIEINHQNASLQKLLTEKDWLLKEVHHRVKNNLQIVMSLLSSQSVHLEHGAAYEAIRESQNRVQAISLIHQKLYKSSNVASINMPAYVSDLLDYLADSFNTRKRYIKFEQVIEPFNLDLAQAVPIGLILNESVTNAIKYAFTDNGGQILVALRLVKNETLLLTIADDGKGFPVNFNLNDTNTLGMEMMKALSKQLGGEFKIQDTNGVRISIEFHVETVLSGPNETSFAPEISQQRTI